MRTGTEAVLTPRAVISNGDFEEYWHFHLAHEHQRLIPESRANTRSAPDGRLTQRAAPISASTATTGSSHPQHRRSSGQIDRDPTAIFWETTKTEAFRQFRDIRLRHLGPVHWRPGTPPPPCRERAR